MGTRKKESESPKENRPKKTKPLTIREKRLFKALLSGEKTLTDAALEAGYSEKFPGQSGSRAIRQIQEKAPDLFARHGLDDDSFVEKCIKPALFATETRAFSYLGEVIYSKPMIAWGARTAANRLVGEMKGMIVKEQETPNASVKIVIINGQHRPQRPAIAVNPLLQAEANGE